MGKSGLLKDQLPSTSGERLAVVLRFLSSIVLDIFQVFCMLQE